ncbi:hypothetical protein HD554DRAFT_2114542 [Boletus coccyginus]|nr:hypothetical protein HD554DRAFT_2114542 [Boletus coccyginus]
MSSAEIILERSTFIGLIFCLILYGINLTLYFLSCRLLLFKQPRMQNREFYITYSSFMLFFVTIAGATNCAFGDLMWIDDRDIQGGPPAFYAENVSAWYSTLGTAAAVTANAMADGLLLYRCFMFWGGHRWVVILPALLYVSSVAMSIVMTIESALPGANIFQGMPTTFSIPWMALTVSFNIIVTLMIIGRLLLAYWTIRETIRSSSSYVNVSSILVESALPLSALGLGYLITQVMNSNVVAAFASVWGMFAVLAPQLIIYRVALGVAWSSDTTFTVTQGINFASNPEFDSGQGSASGQSIGVGDSTLGGSSNMDLRFYKEEKV